MEFLQFCEPTCLSTIEGWWFLEILEVGMVCSDFKRFLGVNKVASEFFKCQHDSKKFLVINFIIPLGRCEGL